MDEIKKNKFREIINQYINKTEYILRYIKNTVCEKEEDRLMQDMMQIFFLIQTIFFRKCPLRSGTAYDWPVPCRCDSCRYGLSS